MSRRAAAPPAGVQSEHWHEWLAQKAVFDRLGERHLRRLRGQWVAVSRGRVVDSDRELDLLRDRAWARARGAAVFVARVGAPAPRLDVPGFTVEPIA